MVSSAAVKKLAHELDAEDTKMGDIKKRAKAVKKDHELALALWATGGYRSRLLAVLIFDKKQLDAKTIDALAQDIIEHEPSERRQLSDWLLANQLMKDKKLVALLESWEDDASPVLRRLFWYHQARLRWTGQTPPENTAALLAKLESSIETAHPDVQWAMNFCAGWIGVHQPEYRSRCIELGEKTGLYRDEKVAKNCTPAYLPEFIRIEAEKVAR